MMYAGDALRSSTGARYPLAPDAATMAVHVGISWTEYARIAANHGVSAGPYSAQGAVLSVAPGRVSYHFGLKGPSVAYGADWLEDRISHHCVGAWCRPCC